MESQRGSPLPSSAQPSRQAAPAQPAIPRLSQVDHQTVQAALEISRRFEANAKLFIEQLMAVSIQKSALEILRPPGYEQELQRIQQLRDIIKKSVAFLDSAVAHKATETQWLAYFDTLFAKTELEAVSELAAKLNHKL